MNRIVSILLVEDDPDDAMLFEKTLQIGANDKTEFQVTHVDMLKKALALPKEPPFDLVIIDLFLPDSEGIHTFYAIKRAFDTAPILVLTGLQDEALAVEAVSHGAQDYLAKNAIPDEGLVKIIRYAIERHNLQASLLALSFADELTGLYNRRGFITLAQQQLDLSRRSKIGFYLLFIDLDHLKKINDTYGHSEGDAAIVQAADCLKRSLRRSDVMGRIGGDEFAVVVIGSRKGSRPLIKSQLEDTLSSYNIKKKHPYDLSFSVGMAYFNPNEELSLEELMEQADQDLYTHKKARRF